MSIFNQVASTQREIIPNPEINRADFQSLIAAGVPVVPLANLENIRTAFNHGRAPSLFSGSLSEFGDLLSQLTQIALASQVTLADWYERLDEHYRRVDGALANCISVKGFDELGFFKNIVETDTFLLPIAIELETVSSEIREYSKTIHYLFRIYKCGFIPIGFDSTGGFDAILVIDPIYTLKAG